MDSPEGPFLNFTTLQRNLDEYATNLEKIVMSVYDLTNDLEPWEVSDIVFVYRRCIF
jgi:hypothetical protein